MPTVVGVLGAIIAGIVLFRHTASYVFIFAVIPVCAFFWWISHLIADTIAESMQNTAEEKAGRIRKEIDKLEQEKYVGDRLKQKK